MIVAVIVSVTVANVSNFIIIVCRHRNYSKILLMKIYTVFPMPEIKCLVHFH